MDISIKPLILPLILPLLKFIDFETLLNLRLCSKTLKRTIYKYKHFENEFMTKNIIHGIILTKMFKHIKLKIKNHKKFCDNIIKSILFKNKLNKLANNLTYLSLFKNKTITNKHISKLINLEYLDLRHDKKITNDGIKNLKNLKSLLLEHNCNITNEGIQYLPKLKKLWISNDNITLDCVIKLKKLDNLIITGDWIINDNNIIKLSKLKLLSLLHCNTITNNGINKLKDLIGLCIFNCKNITLENAKDNGLRYLSLDGKLIYDNYKLIK